MSKSRLAAATTLVALLPLAACSGEGKDYTVPQSLCGARVDADVTKKLLPSGDTVHVLKGRSKTASPRQYCQIEVDDVIDLTVEGVWRAAGTTAQDVAAKEGKGNAEPAEGGKYAVGSLSAFTVVNCEKKKYGAGEFSFEVRLTHSLGDRGADMVAFLKQYAPSYRAALGCE
ncbi:hypothetical protein [Streptomyces sp. NPDC008150]|uniref:hypothetical protein n=1 Tax=Streptomyces sp. NPDC008150 TaxID=3364816 RepID=UPI0036E943FD